MEEKIEDFEEYDERAEQETSFQQKRERPDMRVVQVEVNQNGETMYKSVGAMWKKVSKNGNEFYVLRIGRLKLLVFPNTNNYQGESNEQ